MQYAGYIDGKFVEGEGEVLTVLNPSDETEVARFKGLSTAQTISAIRAARKSFDSGAWSGRSTPERAQTMRSFVAALHAAADRLHDIETAEAGCPRGTGVMYAQVRMPLKQASDVIDLFLALPEMEENPVPLPERVSPMGQVVQSLRRYTPIGVVAGIAAYNFPFYTAMWKAVPALMTGNSVVLRPSPLTPLSAMILAEAAEAAKLPPGVLNVVTEPGHDGARLLTTHDDVDMVAFTGSSTVGVQVMAQCAPTMKRLQLELGGKSAQIFLPDSADKAPMHAAVVCSSHAGQGCALGTRIFVPQEKKADVVERIVKAVEGIRIGPANDPATQLGPVISAGQRARCEHYVKAAVENGARVATGGKRPAHLPKGFYFEPTVLDVPDNSNPAAQDEIFGPVVCVIGYRDLDHAVAMANDSRFGLSGYVHGLDKALALKVGLGIRSGTVNVNAGLASAFASSGGIKMSGIGRERGIEGIRVYQQLSCLNLGG